MPQANSQQNRIDLNRDFGPLRHGTPQTITQARQDRIAELIAQGLNRQQASLQVNQEEARRRQFFQLTPQQFENRVNALMSEGEGMSRLKATLQARGESERGESFGQRPSSYADLQEQANQEVAQRQEVIRRDQTPEQAQLTPQELAASRRAQPPQGASAPRVVGERATPNVDANAQNNAYLTWQGKEQALSSSRRQLRDQPWLENDRSFMDNLERMESEATESKAAWEGYNMPRGDELNAPTGEGAPEGVAEEMPPNYQYKTPEQRQAELEESRRVQLPPQQSGITRQEGLARGREIIRQALESGALTPFEADLFNDSLGRINFEDAVTAEERVKKTIKAFKEVAQNSIDPEFRRQAEAYTKDVEATERQFVEARKLQEEGEVQGYRGAVRGTKADLEARGFTFTGEAVRQLGAESAFAQPGTPGAEASAIPLQRELASGGFTEGLIPQASRLVRTSNEASYLANLRNLGRQAEGALGSEAVRGIGLPTVGGDIGDIERNRQAASRDQFEALLDEQVNREAAAEPLEFDFSSLTL